MQGFHAAFAADSGGFHPAEGGAQIPDEPAIDPDNAGFQGRRYAVWAEKVNVGKKISNLYIAEMATPTRLKTAQVLLTTPDYAWERQGFWVNEGPAVIQRGGRVFLTSLRFLIFKKYPN